jgi:hypothetical protein
MGGEGVSAGSKLGVHPPMVPKHQNTALRMNHDETLKSGFKF